MKKRTPIKSPLFHLFISLLLLNFCGFGVVKIGGFAFYFFLVRIPIFIPSSDASVGVDSWCKNVSARSVAPTQGFATAQAGAYREQKYNQFFHFSFLFFTNQRKSFQTAL